MLIRLFSGLVIVLLATLGFAWADFDSFKKKPITLNQTDQEFVVERGWSARRVGKELYAQGVITSPMWFDILARVEKKAGSIKTGEYTLTEDLTPPGVLDLLMTGQSRQYSASIIEGSMFRQLREKLKDSDLLKATITDLSDEEIMSKIGKPGIHPEGQFFSDTYQFPSATTDLDFLERASKTLDRVLEEEWQNRAPDLPLNSAYEALILASIVEKETAVAEERPLIAGVFMSRLRKKMRLQTDPTVIYGLGPSFDGDIKRKDLRTDTPYNTYTRAGLPPTPIALVGREAIHAVLHPTATSALYFVAKGDGTHHFSKTNEEHNQAVRKYILKK